MSWKDLLLICLILGAVVVVCVARHFVGNVLFFVNHVIAAIVLHTPGFLHFVSALVR